MKDIILLTNLKTITKNGGLTTSISKGLSSTLTFLLDVLSDNDILDLRTYLQTIKYYELSYNILTASHAFYMVLFINLPLT